MIENLVEDDARSAKAPRRVSSTREISRIMDGASAGPKPGRAAPPLGNFSRGPGEATGQAEPDGIG
jgi:hypothetical protein